MQSFIGRDRYLEKLEDIRRLDRASLVVIKGRRRIGKSRLAEEFSRKKPEKKFFSFTGLPPGKDVTAQDQRDNFASELSAMCGLSPFLSFKNWTHAFRELTKQISKNPTIILLDEISWMGEDDPTFIPKLKVWWDSYLQHMPNVMLIFCSSISIWIDENILSGTAFFGRISLKLTIEELSLSECATFLKGRGFKGSTYEIFKILAVTGGIPWYLEQISPYHSADENIKRLAFESEGLFTTEFHDIFHDLFQKKGTMCKEIVYQLADGMKEAATLRTTLNYPSSGFFSEQLEALIISGFITKHYKWALKTGQIGKSFLYRLSDNYLRFFIKYIEPNLPRIKQNSFSDMALSQLSGWDILWGFQIENLLIKNRSRLLESLGIHAADVLADGPYAQKTNTRQKGCQIDYLIQTQMRSLYICEFKFKRRGIDVEIIEEMKLKEKKLSAPRGFAKIPVLFHLGEVSLKVYESKYFYRIIDISDFLT